MSLGTVAWQPGLPSFLRPAAAEAPAAAAPATAWAGDVAQLSAFAAPPPPPALPAPPPPAPPAPPAPFAPLDLAPTAAPAWGSQLALPAYPVAQAPVAPPTHPVAQAPVALPAYPVAQAPVALPAHPVAQAPILIPVPAPVGFPGMAQAPTPIYLPVPVAAPQVPATPAPSAPVPQAPAAPKPAVDKPQASKPKPKPKPEAKPDGRGPQMREGARGAAVKVLERRLDALGYDVGKPDGKFGKATTAAVKRFQKREDLAVDGIVGKNTWRELDVVAKGKVSYPAPAGSKIREKLQKAIGPGRNPHWMERSGCFRYAWSTVTRSGGKTIGGSKILTTGRWKGTAYLSTLEKNGSLKVGDIVYVNRKPQADPTSTNLAYGPHWFVYMGKGQYADQYGTKQSAAEMDRFVPGRYIDQIYRPY